MKEDYTVWKIFGVYMLLILLMIMSQTTLAQSPCGGDGICVVQFNAGFNEGNKVTWVGELDECCTIEPLAAKIRSFNFEVFDVDGHDESKIDQAIKKSTGTGLPRAILCRTTKGKGISFMECNNLWHYKSPQGEDYEKALLELN